MQPRGPAEKVSVGTVGLGYSTAKCIAMAEHGNALRNLVCDKIIDFVCGVGVGNVSACDFTTKKLLLLVFLASLLAK